MNQFSLKRLMLSTACFSIAFGSLAAYARHVKGIESVPAVSLSLLTTLASLIGVGTGVGILFGGKWGIFAVIVLLLLLAVTPVRTSFN